MKELRVSMRVKNNLILKRAENLWGESISQLEIAEKMGLDQGTFGNYINFKTLPVTKSKRFGRVDMPVCGEEGLYWTINAVKISDCLFCEPIDIFPEALWVKMKRRLQLIEVSFDEVEKLTSMDPKRLLLPDEEFERKELAYKTTEIVNSYFTIRQRFAFILKHDEAFNYKASEIADIMGVDKARVYDLLSKCYTLLRRPKRCVALKKYRDSLPESQRIHW